MKAEEIEVDRIMMDIVTRDIDRHIRSRKVTDGVLSDINNTIEVRRKANERRRTRTHRPC